jgi:hypothetical protein
MLTDSDTNVVTVNESRSRTPLITAAISIPLIILSGVLYSRGSSPAAPAAASATPQPAERPPAIKSTCQTQSRSMMAEKACISFHVT